MWLEEKTVARVLATLASPPATCALAPVLSPSPKLRYVVYASVLHFEVEKAQVFDLPHLDLLTGFLLERLDGCGIGAAFVGRDLFKHAVMPDRFLEKT